MVHHVQISGVSPLQLHIELTITPLHEYRFEIYFYNNTCNGVAWSLDGRKKQPIVAADMVSGINSWRDRLLNIISDNNILI